MSNGGMKFSSESKYIEELLGGGKYHFCIPTYQREYQWLAKTQCQTLWNDLREQFEYHQERDYYLGSVIVYQVKDESGNQCFHIVDGQQRIITLSLFLAQFFSKMYGKEKVEKSLDVQYFQDADKVFEKGNSGNSNFVAKLKSPARYRVVSEVLGKTENEYLRYALDFTKKCTKPKDYDGSNHALNSKFFEDQIEECYKDDESNDTDKANENRAKFRQYVLERVHILLIVTSDLEEALTIFDTVNNRGMQLSESDIFKAKLFNQAMSDEKSDEFDKDWKSVLDDDDKTQNGTAKSEDENETAKSEAVKKLLYSAQTNKNEIFSPMTELFRAYMYVLQAKGEVADLGVKLRKFFIDGYNTDPEKLKKMKPETRTKYENIDCHKIGDTKFPWQKVMKDIKSLSAVCQLVYDGGKYPALTNWQTVIHKLGKRECIMPLLVWLFYNVDIVDDEPSLSEGKVQEGIWFFRKIARISFANVLGCDTDKPLFDASVSVSRGEPWSYTLPPELKEGAIKAKIKEKKARTITNTLSSFVYFLELLLHEGGNTQHRVPDDEIEHILPQNPKQSIREGWTEEEKSAARGTLGNLVMLEKKPNIGASDYVWRDKQRYYKESKCKSVQKLLDKKLQHWTARECEDRQAECENDIIKFLEGKLEGK